MSEEKYTPTGNRVLAVLLSALIFFIGFLLVNHFMASYYGAVFVYLLGMIFVFNRVYNFMLEQLSDNGSYSSPYK